MLADCGFEQTGFITQPDTSKSDGPSSDANGWPWRSSISISFTVGYELDVDGSGIGTSWNSECLANACGFASSNEPDGALAYSRSTSRLACSNGDAVSCGLGCSCTSCACNLAGPSSPALGTESSGTSPWCSSRPTKASSLALGYKPGCYPRHACPRLAYTCCLATVSCLECSLVSRSAEASSPSLG